MGNQTNYLSTGGFRVYEYGTVGNSVEINGLNCKIVKKLTDVGDHHSGLPTYANTSDIYVGLGSRDIPRQLRVYKDRNSYMDFDWGHAHRNSDGHLFPKGVVHVQRYHGANGEDARYMTAAEHRIYDAIIRFFAPHARLEP